VKNGGKFGYLGMNSTLFQHFGSDLYPLELKVKSIPDHQSLAAGDSNTFLTPDDDVLLHLLTATFTDDDVFADV
jgi:hypothetical protein